jgi:hypothetical protein
VPTQLPKCFVQMTQQIVGGLRGATSSDHALQVPPLIIDAVLSLANLSIPRSRGVGLKHAVLARQSADRGLVVGGVFRHRLFPGRARAPAVSQASAPKKPADDVPTYTSGAEMS